MYRGRTMTSNEIANMFMARHGVSKREARGQMKSGALGGRRRQRQGRCRGRRFGKLSVSRRATRTRRDRRGGETLVLGNPLALASALRGC